MKPNSIKIIKKDNLEELSLPLRKDQIAADKLGQNAKSFLLRVSGAKQCNSMFDMHA